MESLDALEGYLDEANDALTQLTYREDKPLDPRLFDQDTFAKYLAEKKEAEQEEPTCPCCIGKRLEKKKQ